MGVKTWWGEKGCFQCHQSHLCHPCWTSSPSLFVSYGGGAGLISVPFQLCHLPYRELKSTNVGIAEHPSPVKPQPIHRLRFQQLSEQNPTENRSFSRPLWKP